jgi:hypothetical protein
MNGQELINTARTLVGGDQGLLAVDDPLTVSPKTLKRIGVASDHGGYELKKYQSSDKQASEAQDEWRNEGNPN